MGLYGRVLHSKRGYCAATRVIAQVPVPVVGGDSVLSDRFLPRMRGEKVDDISL